MAEPRRTFLVDAAAGPDLLVRVLGPFALIEAEVTDIRLERRESRVSLAIETVDLGEMRSERIAGRLRALPSVLSVGMAWRSGAISS
jgi:hypothetical protein